MMKRVYKKVADSLGMSPKTVEKVYRLYWGAVREHISSLPLNEEGITFNIFNELQPSVNVPSLGKFYIDYEKYVNMKDYLKARRR